MNPQERPWADHDLLDVVRGAAALYANNAILFLSISALIVPLDLVARIASGSPFYEVVTTLQLLVQLLAVGALIAAVGDAAAGSPPDFPRAFGRALERFWPLLRTALLLILVVSPAAALLFVGSWLAVDEDVSTKSAVAPSLLAAGLVLAVPTAYLIVRWLFALQAVVFEETGTFDSLRASSSAVSGKWWTTLALAMLVAICWYAPGWAARYALGWTPTPVWFVAGILLGTALLPFSVAATTLSYFDRRERHEVPPTIVIATT